ncbi:uncharacterized protein EV422DRAFT_534224 [Fimicolochytrium jonesii]|uniref:uncharacterized protein n=1 Tax=Fimicolochytrium jonesii TaxID=1396493 RepID=UPI0022FE90EA|nr:uncharacterized protein EV422DRAFT_534224 [Fimicolochytrium jonesii]KAI8819757.1 hypothetical protein EV422DRAFT_534224 [Fimicolochytrium jonesii]
MSAQPPQPNQYIAFLETLPKADEEPDYVRPFIAIVWEALAHFGWETPLRRILEELDTPVSRDFPNVVTQALLNVYSDLDREVQRFQSGREATPVSSPYGSPSSSPRPSPPSSPRTRRQTLGRPEWASRFLAPGIYSYLTIPIVIGCPFQTAFRSRLMEREDSRCAITGMPNTTSSPDEPSGPLEAAHVFPYALRNIVRGLSSLLYPPEFFEVLRGGMEIDSPRNGVLISAALHRQTFGEYFHLEHRDGRYFVRQLRRFWLIGPDTLPDTIQFLSSQHEPPHPVLVNVHALIAIIKFRASQAELWKAAGERDDLFPRDEEAQLQRADSETIPPLEI